MQKTLSTIVVALVLIAAVVYAQRSGSSLTAQDLVEIQQLYARYNHTIDSGVDEGMGWARTFTADGEFPPGKVTGHKALAEFAKGFHTKTPTLRHWNTNLMIMPSPGGGASGSVYLLLVDAGGEGKPPTIRTAATYVDDLVKTSEGWRFKKRTIIGGATMPEPRRLTSSQP
ncbi:MAG TPA: nuclear transport factor 2 family protein [Vicinamibacterales bacterium]|nr:nuclear transport factor 2 family protein [Vicinamibacterales bacterium]